MMQGDAHATPTELAAALEAILPGAGLREQFVDARGELPLLLLDDSAANRGLDSETARRVMDNPLYWIFCWASGRVLADHIAANPELVRGRRVLDFGAGSGVAAIAAAKAGAKQVIACDTDPLARAATAFNAQRNDVSLVSSADFNDVSGILDLILVADVLYDRANLGWLARFLRRADEVLVADSRVRDFAEPGYVTIGEVESGTLPDLGESLEFNRVTLYRGIGGA